MASRRNDRRWRILDLLGAIAQDPLRKVAAIGLAILLWTYLDGKVTVEATWHLALRESDSFEPISTEDPEVLQVRIGRREYSLTRCEDGRNGDEIDGVTLRLRGPRHLIESLDENPGYTVVPSLGSGRSSSAEIEVDDIRAINATYQALIQALEPASVIVHVARNETQVAPITRAAILVVPPENVPEFADRLLWDQQVLTATTVTLFGPEEAVSRILHQGRMFRFEPRAPLPGVDIVRGELELIDATGRVHMDPERIHLEIPLRRPSTELRLEGVPVMLYGPPALRERFQPQDATLAVTLTVMNNLEGLLSTKTPEERREWAQKYTVLIAPIPDDEVGDLLVTTPIFVVLDRAFVAGRDYRVLPEPPVRIVGK